MRLPLLFIAGNRFSDVSEGFKIKDRLTAVNKTLRVKRVTCIRILEERSNKG